MKPIQFVDGSKSEYVQKGLSSLCRQLREWGLAADWCRRVEDATPGHILLVHDPVSEISIPDGCVVLGQRTLNRRQRLVLAERHGLPVPRWQSLDDQTRIASLFDAWGVDHFLYKADWSYSRGGIRVMTRDNLIWLNKFNADGDVFMQVLEDCPHTFKIDVAFDQIIACRKLFTRSVFDRRFQRSFTAPSELDCVPGLVPQLKSLGRAVFRYGVGLMNVDLMVDGCGKSWIIELNTCSVGREATWKRWPQVYLPGYALGISRWIEEGCPGLGSNDAAGWSAELSDTSGGLPC